jgi:hypothetical protein
MPLRRKSGACLRLPGRVKALQSEVYRERGTRVNYSPPPFDHSPVFFFRIVSSRSLKAPENKNIKVRRIEWGNGVLPRLVKCAVP